MIPVQLVHRESVFLKYYPSSLNFFLLFSYSQTLYIAPYSATIIVPVIALKNSLGAHCLFHFVSVMSQPKDVLVSKLDIGFNTLSAATIVTLPCGTTSPSPRVGYSSNITILYPLI
jgi:hypothetical protein